MRAGKIPFTYRKARTALSLARSMTRLLTYVSAAAVFGGLAALAPVPAGGQWVATSRQALTAGSVRAASVRPVAAATLNAATIDRARLFEALWRNPSLSRNADAEWFAESARLVRQGTRLSVDPAEVAPEFSKLVPELAGALDWGAQFRLALLTALGSTSSVATRDGEVAELVSRYRARTDFAVSARPKGFDMLDAQVHSLEFRRRFPKSNGLGWSIAWAENAVYENLLADGVRRDASVDRAVVQRLSRIVDSAPALLPIAPAVAPTLSHRYPEAAAILDNLHMLENGIADVLVAREIPRSAKRLALLRLRDDFRNDTVNAITVSQWMHSAEMFGAHNMGGPGAGFPAELAVPSLDPGASMAGMSTHDMTAMGATLSEPAATSAKGQPTLEALLAIHQRMMSDPVIRERVATDPALQKMMQSAGLDSTMAMGAMPGMDHSSMPGMTMTPEAAAGMLRGTAEQRAKALDFVVRLLSDPAVEARIHTSPELHMLWSDPEVQKRLNELKRKPPVKPPTAR